MKHLDDALLDRFHHTLVEEIHRTSPQYLTSSFTVAEIYQTLVPYRTHRDRIGVEMNGDYEDALLRLLAGEGEFLLLESEPAVDQIRRELRTTNPNTGLYREFAALGVRLNPERTPSEGARGAVLPEEMPPLPFISLDDPPEEVEAEIEPEIEAEVEVEPEEEAEGSGTAEPEAAAPEWAPEAEVLTAKPEAAPLAAGTASGFAAEDDCPGCACKLPSRPNLRFCPHCGTNIHVKPCPACGEELDRSWSFCVACGAAAE